MKNVPFTKSEIAKMRQTDAKFEAYEAKRNAMSNDELEAEAEAEILEELRAEQADIIFNVTHGI